MTSRKDLVNRLRKDMGQSEAFGLGIRSLPALGGAPEPESELPDPIGAAHESPIPPNADAPPLSILPKQTARETTAKANQTRAPDVQSPERGKRQERGVAVYIALSLTKDQAARAEAWAMAAGCSVAFLIRRVAQSVRKEIVVDWSAGRIENPPSLRQGQSYASASVTLTLPAPLAQALETRLDPFGLLGLGRAVGPAFRARFAAALDTACTRAGF